jgi:hypothetical protein
LQKIVKNCQKFCQNLQIFANFWKRGSFLLLKLMISRRLRVHRRVRKRVHIVVIFGPWGSKFGPSVHTLCTLVFTLKKHCFCRFWTSPEKNFREGRKIFRKRVKPICLVPFDDQKLTIFVIFRKFFFTFFWPSAKNCSGWNTHFLSKKMSKKMSPLYSPPGWVGGERFWHRNFRYNF